MTHTVLGIDIIGKGGLLEACCAEVGEGSIQVRMLDTVPYGQPFFDLLGQYHAMVIANRNMEQPRVVFDAFSQGVACISSRTEGVVDLIEEGQTGLMFPIDDAEALADLLLTQAEEPSALLDMGEAAREAVLGRSHSKMHEQREKFLVSALGLARSDEIATDR